MSEQDTPEQPTLLNHPDYRLKLKPSQTFSRKLGHFSIRSCSGISCSSASVSRKIGSRRGFKYNSFLAEFEFPSITKTIGQNGKTQSFVISDSLALEWPVVLYI